MVCRWIYHHYFAMAMALISLTWEIERDPDCSQKQVMIIIHAEAAYDLHNKN